MSNQSRDELKIEIDKITHKWMVQTHYEFDRSVHKMGAMLNMDPRSYSYIKAQKNGSSLPTFHLYLFRGCPDAPAFLLEINDKLDEIMPIQNPEEVVSREFPKQLLWLQQAVAHGYTCPHCGKQIEEWKTKDETATV